jgi:lipopolysaccharide export system protein LptC
VLKRLGILAGLAAVLLVAWFVTRTILNQNAEDGAASPDSVSGSDNGTEGAGHEEALALALKTISLSQGEGGFELWRLKAEWANMQKDGDNITVRLPKLTYFSRAEGEPPLHVSSETGLIQQKNQILRFIDNVRITQEDKVLDGDLLVYDGARKSMTFPHGGRFAGSGIKGSADTVEWDIEKQCIVATGDVSVLMHSPASPGKNREAASAASTSPSLPSP